MRTKQLWTIFGLVLCAASACAPTAEEGQRGLSASVEAKDEAAGESLTAYSNSTYFIVTHTDLRRCPYPLCGGAFTQRVNQPTTTCSDGSAQPECRILEFDYSALGLDSATSDRLKDRVQRGQALLRGQISKTAPILGKTYDKLVVQEAWEARGATPSPTPGPTPAPTLPHGTFSRMRELPVDCAACPPYLQEVLNSTTPGNRIAKLLFDPARFSAALVTELTTTLSASAVGLLMAGTRGGSATSPTFAIAEAYTPVVAAHVGKAGDACGSRGLPATCDRGLFCKRDKAALCGRADAGGICTAKPMICPALVLPVCGCDHKTYNNECEAWRAGISVDYDGVCH